MAGRLSLCVRFGSIPLLSLAFAATTVLAQGKFEKATDDQELAQQLANPVASLVSVPFQLNHDTGFGPADADRLTLNIQPVVPFSINRDWNLIVRTIVPVVYQEGLVSGASTDFGLGDTVQSFFFSPKAPVNGWILGLGPVFLWPTATDTTFKSDVWAAGPTGLALQQNGPWTYGALANHLWSYAGDGDYVSASFLQPFLVYTMPTATGIFLNSETTYDWSGEQWIVPINVGVNQLARIGGQPMQFALGYRYYAASPDGGPEWGLRFTYTLLFPK